MTDESEMSDGSLTIERLTKYLKRLNRKERFILLSRVLGVTQAGDVFRLNPPFRKQLGNELGLKIPHDAFVAMDYHLDWLQMALYLARQHGSVEREILYNRDPQLFEASPRDIDLLIAFKERGPMTIHIVLIEAKADTPWKSDQIEKKVDRLRAIFDGKKSNGVDVEPHFVMMSPKDPRVRNRIDTGNWADWMRKGLEPAHWLELPLCDGLLKITRCDASAKNDPHGSNLFFRVYNNGGWKKLSG